MNIRVLLLVAVVVLVNGQNGSYPNCTSGPLSTFPICDQSLPTHQRTADLASCMTTAEKTTHMATFLVSVYRAINGGRKLFTASPDHPVFISAVIFLQRHRFLKSSILVLPLISLLSIVSLVSFPLKHALSTMMAGQAWTFSHRISTFSVIHAGVVVKKLRVKIHISPHNMSTHWLMVCNRGGPLMLI
jgi:hypothetical protein